jgi:transposase
VARERLLRPRHPETVYLWLNRWEAEGIDSLPIRDGRGRKPAFSP